MRSVLVENGCYFSESEKPDVRLCFLDSRLRGGDGKNELVNGLSPSRKSE